MFAERLSLWLFRLVTRFPWAVLAASALVAALLISGVRELSLSHDHTAFFQPSDPDLVAYRDFEDIYTNSNNMLWVVTRRDRGRIFQADTLAAIAQLTALAKSLPHTTGVDSLTNYQHVEADAVSIAVGDLVPAPAVLEAAQLARIERIAMADPQLRNRLVAADGRAAGINVSFHLPAHYGADLIAELSARARAVLADVEREHPGIALHATGTVLLDNAFMNATDQDLKRLLPLSLAVVLAVLALFVRDPALVLVSWSLLVLCMVIAMGVAGWCGLRLTPPSLIAPVAILCVAVADLVHLLASFQIAYRRRRGKRRALYTALRANVRAISLTTAATVIGFGCMNFSQSPPFSSVGNIAVVGMLVAWVAACVVLPALIVLLPIAPVAATQRIARLPAALAEFVLARWAPILFAGAALLVVTGAGLSLNRVNDVYLEYFDQSTRFRVDTDFTTERLTGLYRIDYSLQHRGGAGISDPRFAAQVDRFAGWLREQHGVLHVDVYTDTLKRINRAMNSDSEQYAVLPPSAEAAAQYLLMYEMSLPAGQTMNAQISADKSGARLNATLQTVSVDQLLSLRARADTWLADNAPAIASRSSGISVLYSQLSSRSVGEMLIGTAVSLGLIALLLACAIGPPVLGALCVVPNVLPLLLAFGLWGVVDGEIGLGLSFVAAITLGLAVDDTIHFVSKYAFACRQLKMGNEDAVRYAFASVGVALCVTSLALVGGFSVLAFSTFKVNADLGLMAALTVSLALLVDLIFLPPILVKLKGLR